MTKKQMWQPELFSPEPVKVDFNSVGLDLSQTASGIVVLSPEGDVSDKKVVGYGLTKEDDERAHVERYLYIVGAIVDTIKAIEGPVKVGIEGYAFGTVKSKKTGRKFQSASQTGLAELRGAVKTQLWLACDLVPVTIAPSEARRFVLGKGNTPKASVKPLLESRGLSFDDDNEADAYVVAECLRRR